MLKISLKFKIFLICNFLYILTLTASCFLITENSYQDMLNSEVQRFLNEEKSLDTSISFYFNSYKKYYGNITSERFSNDVIQAFSSQDIYLQIYDDKKTLLSSNKEDLWKGYSTDNLDEALIGSRNYILRSKESKHYLTISDPILVTNFKLVLGITKDITYIDDFKNKQYMSFMKTGFIGLIFVFFISYVLISFTMLPIKKLTKTTKSIAAGNFSERVMVKQKDEVGILANQFNRMADEIEKTVEKLKAENERKQRFIDSLTHELRTPLTSIIGYSDFLLEAKVTDKGTLEKALGYIKSEGKRMLNMVGNLMELILIRKNSIELEKVDILQVFEDVKTIMYTKAKKAGTEIKIESENTIAQIDKDMIKQLLINLLDNAIKASSEGSKVVLGCKNSTEHMEIFVKDFGKGIDESEIEKIFEPFYTIDKSRSRKEGGVGLGLAICSEIIKAHNGKVEIESQVGNGTTITIILINE